MQISIFGLGRMGMQIAKRLHKNFFKDQPYPHYENVSVFAWNRSEWPVREFREFGGYASQNISEVIAKSNEQRIFWLMLPHKIVDEFLQNQLGPYLKAGDIVIDGGNSFYKDSIRRAQELKVKDVAFFDCGISGGVWGEERGFAIMVGGEKEKWGTVEPIFKALSSGPDATVGGAENYGLVGKNGAGHFVKMVHNGIEYGMMESIAEGYGVLKASDFNLDLAQVSKIYQKGSVVSSWLIDLTRNIFEKEDIGHTSGIIESTGEGEWTVKTAKELGVDARVIEDAFLVRQESSLEKNRQKYSNKIVALLRKQFGGHKILK